MPYLHCRVRIQVPTQIQILNPMATLNYAEPVDGLKFRLLSELDSSIITVPIFRTDIHIRFGIRVRVRQCVNKPQERRENQKLINEMFIH